MKGDFDDLIITATEEEIRTFLGELRAGVNAIPLPDDELLRYVIDGKISLIEHVFDAPKNPSSFFKAFYDSLVQKKDGDES
ncbi:MAG: hypothetical protein Q8K86_01545 [Candidatus Nanopelagicaceae bacterium]|nr:hypothetical protein [Candidatus Nanopelagicaceae bacterium]